MNSHNIAQLPTNKRTLIELHKSATLADFKQLKLTVEQQAIVIVYRLKNGTIDRNRTKKLIDNYYDREKLRSLINEYREVLL